MRLNEITPVFTKVIDVENMIDGNIYISKRYGMAIHLCACGCKGITVTPFEDGPTEKEKYWGLTDNNGVVTLHGSIGNYKFPCKSHYNIESNKIVWHAS